MMMMMIKRGDIVSMRKKKGKGNMKRKENGYIIMEIRDKMTMMIMMMRRKRVTIVRDTLRNINTLITIIKMKKKKKRTIWSLKN